MPLIKTYLKLNKTEDAEFQRLVAQPDAEEIREMISIYEERGIQKGIKQGIEQGKRETLLRLLNRKFGTLPEDVKNKVEAIQEEAQLDTLLDRILDAHSLEEMGLNDIRANGAS